MLSRLLRFLNRKGFEVILMTISSEKLNPKYLIYNTLDFVNNLIKGCKKLDGKFLTAF